MRNCSLVNTFVVRCQDINRISFLYPKLGKRELIFLLSFTGNYVVSVRRGFLLLSVLGIGCVILLWHSLCLPYNYFANLYLVNEADILSWLSLLGNPADHRFRLCVLSKVN